MPVTLPSSTSVTITNPLVLYRALLATKQIEPDPAQHRLALHLQKLYYRLKDYEPEIEYRKQLEQIGRTVDKSFPQRTTNANEYVQSESPQNRIFSGIVAQRQKSETLALIKKYTSPESAIKLQSPQGLLLYGEVGTGKSMLIDLLADSLPTRKKRRWHFNTFMLDAYARLEHLRRTRASLSSGAEDENSLLRLARDMISTSPILFLDEFQLPDRASSKILSNLFTSFFHLGGVLIATSNRMPDELANATGVEFAPPSTSQVGFLGNRWGLLGKRNGNGRNENMFGGKSDFAVFLEVLKARCEVWDMEGHRDWRRREFDGGLAHPDATRDHMPGNEETESFEGLEPMQPGNWGLGYEQSADVIPSQRGESISENPKHPRYYHLNSAFTSASDTVDSSIGGWPSALKRAARLSASADPIPWQATSLTVYGRLVPIPNHYLGTVLFRFPELCAANYGPADYISIASNFHTLVLTDVPVLTTLQKNEARRLITLLDALYEARCKLLVRADAGPDALFFPETRVRSSEDDTRTSVEDGTYAETFSEIYQDSTAPFRPNISSYTPSSSPPNYTPSPLPSNSYTGSQSHPSQRSILADEDSDFGPVYGAGCSSAAHHPEFSQSSRYRGVSDGAPGAGNEIGSTEQRELNFQRSGAFTGEDERFAYKRARSRLWEMCGARWWARGEGQDDVSGWWKPVDRDGRGWEGVVENMELLTAEEERRVSSGRAETRSPVQDEQIQNTKESDIKSTSPFRTIQEPPPKIPWTHAWGMMKWGKKAGAWGKGVEGLEERKKKDT